MTNSPYGSAAHQLACELAAMTLASETGGHNPANDGAIERLIVRAREIAAADHDRDAIETEQLTEALGNPLPVPAIGALRHSADLGGYDAPNPLPDRRWRVRFYKEEMTVDRYSITVAADSPSEARARVKAWGNGELELTQEEEESEHYDRQVDTRACEFSSLEEENDPYAVAEVDHAGRQLA